MIDRIGPAHHSRIFLRRALVNAWWNSEAMKIGSKTFNLALNTVRNTVRNTCRSIGARIQGASVSKIEVRQAVLSDIEAAALLFDEYRQFYGRESKVDAGREFLLSRLNRGESVIFIAFDEGKPIGFTQLYPSFSSLSLAPVFVLNDLYVRPSARRAGAGRRLLDAAAEYAQCVGAAWLTLSTAVTNESAQALYEKSGWQRDHEFLVYNLMVKA